MSKRSGAQRRYHPGSPFQAPPETVIERFAVDDRVTHDEYGLGRVVTVEDEAVTVDFGARTVRLTSPFRRLTRL